MLDYRLASGIDGYETARRIREIIPTLKIIMVTADYSIKEQVLASGFSFIPKPFSVQEFLKCLVKEEPDEKSQGCGKGKMTWP